MDINLLKTFLEVTKTRNFARAAENLYVTSAAVSARVKQLESQLGVTLFNRHRGNMQLTTEAERLLPLAETIISTWSRTLQEVSLQPAMESRVYIGAPASLWILAMEERLLLIRQKLPEVALQAEAHANEALVRLLEDQMLDLVLLPDPHPGLDMHSEKIGEQQLVLCSTYGAELSLTQENPYVYVDWGTAFAGFHARRVGEKLTPTLHVNMASIALSVIEAEGGSAYLPRAMADHSNLLTVVKGAPVFKRPIYACYREQNSNVDTLRALVKLLNRIRL